MMQAAHSAYRLLADAEHGLAQPHRAERLGAEALAFFYQQSADSAQRNLGMILRSSWVVLRSRSLRGDLGHAEQAYREAQPFLDLAAAVRPERALLLCGLAQLRWAERRLDEAAALFAHAGEIFSEAADPPGEAACRAQGGRVLWEQGSLGRALAELTLARVRIDPQQAPALAVRLELLLAECQLAAGQIRAADECLAEARALYAHAAGAGEDLFHRWAEARIAAARGSAGDADDLLDGVRKRLFATASVAEAARCSFDLLSLRVAAGRPHAISELGADLIHAFGSRASALRPGQLIDWLAALAVQRPAEFPAASSAIRQYLMGLATPARDLVPGRPVAPQDRPDLIVSFPRLADALLLATRREGAAAGAAGAF